MEDLPEPPAPAHVILLTLSGMNFHEEEEGRKTSSGSHPERELSDPLTRGCSSAPTQKSALHSAAGPPPHVRVTSPPPASIS